MKTSPRFRRWSLIAAGLLVVYAVVGFFVVPWIARGQIEQRASAALHRPVTVQRVQANPFTMSVTVHGLAVTDHDSQELAAWERLFVNADPLTSLFRWQWSLGEVHLVHPRGRLAIAPDGTLNIADLLAPSADAEPADEEAALPAVAVDLLRVDNLEVTFSDHSRRTPFQTVAGPLSYEMRDFSTKPGAAGTYSFSGRTNAIERFAWTGSVSVAPLGSKGHIEFAHIDLPPQMPLIEEFFAGRVTGGSVSLSGNYDVSLAGALQARLEDATLAVENLKLQLPEASGPAVTWDKLEINMPSADAVAQTADISRLALSGLDLSATRRADGSIDLLGLLPATPAEPAPSPPAEAAPPPRVRIAELALIDGRVTVTDEAMAQPGTLVLEGIQVTAQNAGTELDRTVDLDMSARWGGGGEITGRGTVRPQPLLAALDVTGKDIALTVLQPWVVPFASVTLAAGTHGFTGRIEAEQAEGKPLSLMWQGDVRVDQLDVRDTATGEALLAWDSLTHTGTRFTLDPLEVAADSIALVHPVVHLAVDESGALNLQSVLPAPSGEEPKDEAPAPAAATVETQTEATASTRLAAASRQSLPFQATVGEVAITGGIVRVTDRSVPGGFASELRELTGTIRGLSSEQVARADVDFTASLEGVAPLEIKGAINPLAQDLFSDVRVALHNIDLPWFTPYAGKYLGQAIQKGKLNVDLTYRLSENFLEAENRAVLDQFYLGEKVESPDALKLPIGLALAVLREPDGTIPIDMPIRGSLDDPDFKYGQLVVQFISNLFVKAATAPFKMLGGLFGGGRDIDISFVDFASGSSELQSQAEDKLGVLRTALQNRPALRLEINAPAAPAGDRAGLQAARLDALLRSARTEPSEAELTPEETDSLLRAVFAQRFPAEAAAAQASPDSAEVDEATGPKESDGDQDSRQPGFLKRVARTLFGSEEEKTPAPTAAEPATDAEAPAPPTMTAEEIRTRLLATIELTDADFQELAAARARLVREHLITNGAVAPERIFIVATPRVPEDATAATDGGRVFFGLQ